MKQKLLCKVCGMTLGDNIRQVEQLGVDWIGFIFYPRSPRFLDALPDYLPQRAERVGVFVDQPKEEVLMYADRFGLQAVQLHGHESPGYCRSLCGRGLRIIKAFPVATADDLLATTDYEGCCDYYLFDTKSTQPGGSGQSFDWSVLQAYHGRTPFLLSGGIRPEQAAVVRALRHPLLAGIDLNSRFESSPGVKDIQLLRQFLDAFNEE